MSERDARLVHKRCGLKMSQGVDGNGRGQRPGGHDLDGRTGALGVSARKSMEMDGEKGLVGVCWNGWSMMKWLASGEKGPVGMSKGECSDAHGQGATELMENDGNSRHELGTRRWMEMDGECRRHGAQGNRPKLVGERAASD